MQEYITSSIHFSIPNPNLANSLARRAAPPRRRPWLFVGLGNPGVLSCLHRPPIPGICPDEEAAKKKSTESSNHEEHREAAKNNNGRRRGGGGSQ
ncbi:hypothetical protein GUJ93_ZPchr0013g34479 [Zizania palustris]|uniref:Uncharacterized protein n=1 Tax=Zizania palustris TaxID=103762 RepID=A0A8J5X283_ZIZPA|nr:hypothetical protein GUJ93_ZPchr0013g34479 [Zizania palustris]KAG8100567.1 hypothetical protein GUJ93_ZPchr0013g34479 [Zizania palustris]